jgi:hypothetical protein
MNLSHASVFALSAPHTTNGVFNTTPLEHHSTCLCLPGHPQRSLKRSRFSMNCVRVVLTATGRCSTSNASGREEDTDSSFRVLLKRIPNPLLKRATTRSLPASAHPPIRIIERFLVAAITSGASCDSCFFMSAAPTIRRSCSSVAPSRMASRSDTSAGPNRHTCQGAPEWFSSTNGQAIRVS